MWSDYVNDILPDVPTPALEDVVKAALQVSGGQWAVCFDLVSSFFQVLLAEEVRPYYAFVIEVDQADGSRKKVGYAYKRLPMGTTFSPEVMQAVVQAMANIVQDQVFGVRGSEKELRPVVHIDNVRFLANTRKEATMYAEKWLKLCADINVTCGDEPGNTPHQEGDFLGLQYDYAKGTVQLAKKTLSKLHQLRERLVSDPMSFSLREVAKLFGVCCFSSRALRLQTAEYFTVFKYIRRKAAKIVTSPETIWDMPANIWNSILPEWRRWCDTLLENTPVGHPDPEDGSPTYVLITDASTFGWGAILFDERTGATYQAQGAWEKTFRSHDINYLEMRAVRMAIGQFEDILATRPDDKLLVLVDNTSTRDVLVKGHAREYLFNGELSKVLSGFAGSRRILIAHIPSEENPTDILSRQGKRYTEQELNALQSTLGALGGRLARAALPVRVPAARRVGEKPIFVSPMVQKPLAGMTALFGARSGVDLSRAHAGGNTRS